MLKRSVPLLAVLTVVALSACAPPETNPTAAGGSTDPGSSTPAEAPSTSAPGGCEYLPDGEPAKPVDPPSTEDVATTGEVTVTLEMTEGPVSITMDQANAPCAVNSFLSLATQDYYDGTSCHRLSDSGSLLILQCGDPTATGSGGPGYQFDDELTGEETYAGGTVAMANAGPGTNGSQFFLVYDDSALPPSYTVLGQMDEQSRGVVARMSAEGQDGSNPDGTGTPNNPAEILDVTVG